MIKINENENFEWFRNILKKDKNYKELHTDYFKKLHYLNLETSKDASVRVEYKLQYEDFIFFSIEFGATKVMIKSTPEHFREKLKKFDEKFWKGFMPKIRRRFGQKIDVFDQLDDFTPARIIYNLKLFEEDDIEFIHNLMEKELPKFLRAAELQLRRRKGRV